MQIRKMFEQRYPQVPIVGSNFEPSAEKKTTAGLVRAAAYSAIGMTLGGDHLFSFLGTGVPAEGTSFGDMYKAMKDNKFYTCAGTYFVGNTIAENMLSTGAFEIYYDGKMVYSKLETGRLPRINEIMQSMDEAMDKADMTLDAKDYIAHGQYTH